MFIVLFKGIVISNSDYSFGYLIGILQRFEIITRVVLLLRINFTSFVFVSLVLSARTRLPFSPRQILVVLFICGGFG